MSTAPRVSPQEAWDELAQGNLRFVEGGQDHPNQGVERRSSLAATQAPDVALFGCSDSRLSAEIIFDRGLGDLFIARNMGHVVAESITASMEYAVVALGVALIVVLAPDSCGAVAAALDQMSEQPADVTAGRLGIVGCQYRLAEGRVAPVSAVGPLGIALELIPDTSF